LRRRRGRQRRKKGGVHRHGTGKGYRWRQTPGREDSGSAADGKGGGRVHAAKIRNAGAQGQYLDQRAPALLPGMMRGMMPPKVTGN